MVPVDFLLDLLAALLAVPVVVLFLEVTAATFFASKVRKSKHDGLSRPRIAVLVPAHNESSGLRPTIGNIRSQLRQGDRLLVVADNCSDDTAEIAAAAGAEVTERNDLSRVGKGYALDWGLRHLSADAPKVVIVIDADCRIEPGAIDILAKMCAFTSGPVQSLDLMKAPEHSNANYRVAEFAWRVKNWVRPLGLWTLGLPCQLMGTGMALPWDLTPLINVASSETVEDLKLGIDLALAGHPPIFCPAAVVVSEFPQSDTAAAVQRQRWEQGHLRMILSAVPRLIWAALVYRRMSLLALALDLAVPPLVVLWLLNLGVLIIAGVAYWIGLSSAALIISGCSFVGLTTSIFVSRFGYGRDLLPPRELFALAYFVLTKFRLYRRMLGRKAPLQWVRTEREIPPHEVDHDAH